MPLTSDTAGSVSRRALWFGLLGGAVAWTLHLMASYVVAEFGCVMASQSGSGGGITATVVLLTIVSVVCLAGAVAATAVAYRSLSRLRDRSADDADAERFMARAGLIASGLFAFIVAVESVPILFFLSRC